jgi:hypothetical protein
MTILKKIVKRVYENLFFKEIDAQLKQVNDLTEEVSNLKASIEKIKIRKQLDFPKNLGIINLREIYIMLKSICPEVYISDTYFNITSQEEYSRFSNDTAVQYKKFVAESVDCDNFSFELMGYFSQGLLSYAFGIVFSATHAFNICVTDKKEIFVVEPQTNKYIPLEEAKLDTKYYPFRMICM